MHIGLVKMVPIGSMSPLLMISFFSYYITDSGRDSFVLPFPMWWDLMKTTVDLIENMIFFSEIVFRFLFDWKNPIGYIFAFVQEYILIMNSAIAGLITASFGVGTCLMFIAMAKDIKNDMRCIRKLCKNHQNRREIIEHFNKFIQFHSEVTQLSVYLWSGRVCRLFNFYSSSF